MQNWFYVDTDKKLKEIFAEHCDLSQEQYEELRAQFIYLLSDYQEGEPQEEIERRISYMIAAFEFLYNTKELTLAEHCALNELIETVTAEAIRNATNKTTGGVL